MKQIKLSTGDFALVDNEDYEYLNQFKWNGNKGHNTIYATKNGVYINRVRQKIIRMHRLIMNVSNPKILIDHIDGNGLNNQKSNLRICTQKENCRNRKTISNKTGYLGVCLTKKLKTNPFQARICVNYKIINLGFFPTAKEAALAYNNAAILYHNRYATLNII